MSIEASQIPNWFMACSIVVLCAYTGYSLKERNDDMKKALMEIFGRLNILEKKQEHLEGEHAALTCQTKK